MLKFVTNDASLGGYALHCCNRVFFMSFPEPITTLSARGFCTHRMRHEGRVRWAVPANSKMSRCCRGPAKPNTAAWCWRTFGTTRSQH